MSFKEDTPLMSTSQQPIYSTDNNKNNSNMSDGGRSFENISESSARLREHTGSVELDEVWDFVLGYPGGLTDGTEDWKRKDELRTILFEDLQHVGLTVRKEESRDNKGYFLLIKANEDRLEEQAELLGLYLVLKPEYHSTAVPFTRSKKDLFQTTEGGGLFTQTLRQHLIYTIITSDADDGGADIDLDRLTYEGVLTNAFPLHDDIAKEKIIRDWVLNFKWANRKVPLDALRNYFGEEIGFYYGWLSFYTRWLWVAAAVGAVTEIIGWSNIHSENKWSNSIYSIFMAFWVTLFLEFWKRERNVLAWRWNMLNYEEVEGVRPGFKGSEELGVYSKGEFVPLREDEVYGLSPPKPTKYFPKSKIQLKMMSGLGIIALLCAVVVMATMSVLTVRLVVQRDARYATYSSVVGGIMNAVVIMILNKVYRTVAVKMNEWENHRTASDFRDHLLFKIFLFQFVNSYTSLYYIGFFKRHTFLWGDVRLKDECTGEEDPSEWGWGCPNELQIQLLTLLGTNIVVGQAQEVLIPLVTTKLKMWYYQYVTAINETDLPKYEREHQLNAHEGTFDEYSEMVIQYGYITLFAAAFPLAPLLAVLNNVVEMRTDTFKFLRSYNKPVYRGADDIGGWYAILEVLGVIAVITNSLLIAFSFPTLYKIFNNPYLTLITVVAIEHAIFVIKYLLSIAVPDVPANIRVILAKQYYIEQQIVKKYPFDEGEIKKVR